MAFAPSSLILANYFLPVNWALCFQVASGEALNMNYEFNSDRYFEKLYSSKLRLSRRILRMERQASLTLSSYLNESNNQNYQRLASDLEWLFSWKLKKANAPEPYWCDGVEDIVLKRTGKYEFQLTAMIWIGPESNVDTLNKVKISGNVALKPSGKCFKRYYFKITYNNDSLVLKKT